MKFRKKYWIESVETLFVSQKYHSDVLSAKKFRKLLNILKFESKVRSKDVKEILNTWKDNLQKVLVRIS